MLPVKNLFVLYTGGTIGMLQPPQGLAPAGGFEARMRDHLQSLADAPDLRWRFAELQPPLDSANMTQGNWLAMRDAIVAALDAGHDGVLLLHGTDTLAYSAAALSFLLLDLPIPVLLTGSMLPAGAPGSDAWDNLVGALRVLQEGHARGVQVYFNDALLHGARVSKLRSDAFDAFAELPRPRHAEHAPVPAALGYRQPRREVNLAVLPLYPGLRAAHLRGLLDSGVEALLLECYGSGTGPSDDEELLALLREAHARGVLLAAVSQCAYGQVEFGVYAAGSRLRDAGLLSAGGMTREAALGKLFGLLGAGLGRDEAQRWFALDLCGENAD
ncbi:asparaginase [Pseudomonas aeruginosa]|uniref:asparaginase n=1 Tax=Pseudomonas aeruginosa TaxID=287 RepID=UPI000941796C|nr:asparaginase [Pseudomonas aeruginosa]OKQ84821.1 L-asparaginase 1 [Pseudomonas aeruginosa]